MQNSSFPYEGFSFKSIVTLIELHAQPIEVCTWQILRREEASRAFRFRTEDPHLINSSYICMQDFTRASYEGTQERACPRVTLLDRRQWFV